jgi:hypothetical protein
MCPRPAANGMRRCVPWCLIPTTINTRGSSPTCASLKVHDRTDELQMMSTGVTAEPIEIGTFSPSMKPVKQLTAGEVGYIATGFKTVRECRVGDTITLKSQPGRGTAARLQGSQTDGLCRFLPHRRGRLRPAA